MTEIRVSVLVCVMEREGLCLCLSLARSLSSNWECLSCSVVDFSNLEVERLVYLQIMLLAEV